MQTLLLCTKTFHDLVTSNSYFQQAFLPHYLLIFSDKEKQILKFMTTGKAMKMLPTETGISIRYGEKLLRGLRVKFGNISTAQLTYYIGLLQLVE